MQGRGRALVFLLGGIAVASAAAAPVPEVQIEQRDEAFAVFARLSVAVTRATAWEVITDYDHVGDFVADMHESRVVRRAGERVLVRQAGAWNVFGFRVPVWIVAQVEEQPMRSVRFHSISGNVHVGKGEWRITQDGGGVAITYRAECTPDFWVPPVLGVVLMRRDVRAKLEQVAREMLRRDAAQRTHPSLSLPEPAS